MPGKQNETTTESSQLATGAAVTAEEALRQIGESDNPGDLVRALAPYDLLAAWHMADDEQRADLLRLADKSQVDLLIDLRCWSSDTPDIDALEELVGPLVLSDIGGAIRVIDTLEPEIRTLLFKRNAKVHLIENRNDELLVPDESEVVPSPDGFYFVEFPDPDMVTDVERALLQALFCKPFEEYQLELECIRHDLPSELTEMAYRWRNGRLADHGFQSREEALEIVVPISVEEARDMASKAAPIDELPIEVTLPRLYRDNLSGNEFLDQVIEIIRSSDDPDVENRQATLGAELAAMTNLFFSAVGVDIGNIGEVARHTAWARDMLSLGLIETANGDEEEAARLLTALSPSVFLKVSLDILYPLRRRAAKLLSDRKLIPVGRKGSIFDPPYYIALSCLNRYIPAHCPALDQPDTCAHSLFEPKDTDLRAFSTRHEVALADRILEEAEQLPSLLFDALKCEQPPLRATPASILVLNALANAMAGRDPVPRPIMREEANVFQEQMLALSEDQLLTDALAVLLPLVDMSEDLPRDITNDSDPMRRLITRLVRIGRSRLSADAPERTLLIENF